jgi:hypothetical protein
VEFGRCRFFADRMRHSAIVTGVVSRCLRAVLRRDQLTSAHEILVGDLVWALGSVSALNHRPFDAELLARDLPPPPITTHALISAARTLKFRIQRRVVQSDQISRRATPCLALFWQDASDREPPLDTSESSQSIDSSDLSTVQFRLALIAQVTDNHVLPFRAGTDRGVSLSRAKFAHQYANTVFQLGPTPDLVRDPDNAQASRGRFSFGWFIPEPEPG